MRVFTTTQYTAQTICSVPSIAGPQRRDLSPSSVFLVSCTPAQCLGADGKKSDTHSSLSVCMTLMKWLCLAHFLPPVGRFCFPVRVLGCALTVCAGSLERIPHHPRRKACRLARLCSLICASYPCRSSSHPHSFASIVRLASHSPWANRSLSRCPKSPTCRVAAASHAAPPDVYRRSAFLIVATKRISLSLCLPVSLSLCLSLGEGQPFPC